MGEYSERTIDTAFCEAWSERQRGPTVSSFHLDRDKRAALDDAARARHRRRAGGAGRRPVRAAADGARARAHPAGPPRPAPDRLGAQHRRRPAHRGGCGEGVRGELRRVRAGPRARARLPPSRRHRRDRGAGELLRHDPHPAAGRGDGGVVPARARGQGHRHRADAPRVRPGDVPVHRRRAGGGAAAAARRRAAPRPDRRRARQPAPRPALRARRAVRDGLAEGRRHGGPAGVHGGGGRGRGHDPGAHRGRRGGGAVRRAPVVLLPRLRLRPAAPGRLPGGGGQRRRHRLPRRLRARGRGRLPARPSTRNGSRAGRGRCAGLAGAASADDCSDRRVVRGGAGPHGARPGGRVPRLREPLRAGRDARRPPHPRAGLPARGGRHLRRRTPTRCSSRPPATTWRCTRAPSTG